MVVMAVSNTQVKANDKKQLSEKELKAFVNLLSDSEEKTLNLMAEQLVKFDDLSIKRIQELTEAQNDLQLIDNWYHTSKVHLSKQIKDWKQDGDLETGLFLLARFENPGLDVAHYKNILDTYTQRVEDKLNPSSTEDAVIASINQVLYKEEGFVGNQIDYYDINNNFLNTVLDFKTGNPIMISAVYILIARRLGLQIEGVGTPGHFIVRFRDKLYDPFFSGREISKDECVLRAQELSVFWRDEYLDPIGDVFIVARCIRNLIAIYKKNDDLDKAAEISTLLKLV
jgi:regulator of sirC expression with transglutaminase-like and TPR domain